jgi:hypothetical protein
MTGGAAEPREGTCTLMTLRIQDGTIPGSANLWMVVPEPSVPVDGMTFRQPEDAAEGQAQVSWLTTRRATRRKLQIITNNPALADLFNVPHWG